MGQIIWIDISLKHVEKCPTVLTSTKMQIKMTRYYFTSTRIAVNKRADDKWSLG